MLHPEHLMWQAKSDPNSDIFGHLDYLKRCAMKCGSVTEMGIREGVSTRAFLSGLPVKYRGYDIIPIGGILRTYVDECGRDYKIEQADSKTVEIEQTNLLFIDTLHNGDQLWRELNQHHEKVMDMIILHDTETFGHKDEKTDFPNPQRIGLMRAVMDFLHENPEWCIFRHSKDSNGLTTLRRIDWFADVLYV